MACDWVTCQGEVVNLTGTNVSIPFNAIPQQKTGKQWEHWYDTA